MLHMEEWREIAVEARDTFFKVNLGRSYITMNEWFMIKQYNRNPPFSLPKDFMLLVPPVIEIDSLNVKPLACMIEHKYGDKDSPREEILKYAIDCIRYAVFGALSG